MEEIKLSSHITTDAVLLPAVFIDQYMPNATGDQVKVYLYLLRQISSPTPGFSLKSVATTLSMEENDVRRALSYWEKQGLLKVEVSDYIVTGILFLPFQEIASNIIAISQQAIPQVTSLSDTASSQPQEISSDKLRSEESNSSPAKADIAADTASPVTPVISKSQPSNPAKTQEIAYDTIPWDELNKDADFQMLLRAAQSYLKNTLRPSDCERIAYWYILFESSADIIEYLIEYCVDLGKDNFRYMEKVALNWHEQGLKTLAEVKQYSKGYLPAYRAVAKGMGLKDRNLNSSDSELLKKWVGTYHFSPDIIQYACEQTIQAIHSPSLEYADKKLEDWHQKGFTTLEQAKQAEQSFRANQAKTKKTAAAKTTSQPRSKNRFINFEQRDTDYNEYFKDFYEYSSNNS